MSLLAHLRQQLLVVLDVGIHYRGVRKPLVRLQCRPSRVHAAQGVAGSVAPVAPADLGPVLPSDRPDHGRRIASQLTVSSCHVQQVDERPDRSGIAILPGATRFAGRLD